MVTGEVPFKGKTDFQTFDIIMKREFNWPEGMDEDCKDLINKLLQLEPMKRLGAGRPGSGNSYEDLMLHPFFKGINWLEIGKAKIPYDTDELKNIIKKKQVVDIFEDETETTNDTSERQSEINVKLNGTGDFEKLFSKGKELKRGWLMKRNPWFVNQKRLFILTDEPKLMYLKDEENLRGEIPLSSDTLAKKI